MLAPDGQPVSLCVKPDNRLRDGCPRDLQWSRAVDIGLKAVADGLINGASLRQVAKQANAECERAPESTHDRFRGILDDLYCYGSGIAKLCLGVGVSLLGWVIGMGWRFHICMMMLVVGVTASGYTCASGQLPVIVLGTVLDSREVDVGIGVLVEAYRRAGIKLEVRRYPGEVALRKANAGEVDGDVHRMNGISSKWPNLLQVPVPINYIEVAVYSVDDGFVPESWYDLRLLQVGVVRGIPAIEAATHGLDLRQVDAYSELFRLLERHEVDVIVAPVVEADDHFRRNGNPAGVVRNGIIDSFLLYHYLNKSNANLVPKIQRVLRDMLRDGDVARIRAATYSEGSMTVKGGK